MRLQSPPAKSKFLAVQGGLAGAIMTSEGNALGVTYGKGEVFEEDTGSKFNAEVFDSKHGGGVGESGEEEN